MKKILAALMLVGAVSAASAGEFTLGASQNLSKTENSVDMTYGMKIMDVKTEFGYSTNDSRTLKNDQWSAGVSLPIAKLGQIQTSAKVAGVYVDSRGLKVGGSQSGFGVRYGVEAELPLTKSFALVGNVSRFDGASRVRNFEGNIVGLAGRFTF